MELRDYLRLLGRRWRTIVAVLVASLAGATVVTVLQPPSYQATTQILVAVPQGAATSADALSVAATANNLPEVVAGFAQLAGSPQAVQAAVAQAGLASAAGVQVVAGTQGGTAVMVVAAVAPTASSAQAVANAYVSTYPDVLVSLNQLGSPDVLSFETLIPAALPTSTYRPDPVVNTAIGLAVGLLLGLGAAVVREALDRRIRDSRAIEDRTALTVLGVVPYELGGVDVPADSHPDSARTEAYRKIRTGLMFSGPDGIASPLVVTSAVAGEGKSSLATNLAVICAQAGQRVALVDADMRKPTIHSRLHLTNERGLSNVLAGELGLEEVARTLPSGVTVVTSGPSPRDPSAMLEAPELRKVLLELGSTHDVVIIDTTPLLAVSDAAQVCALSGGAVLVSQLRRTTYDSVVKARTTLERVRTTPLGVVAVGKDEDPDAGYRYYYGTPGEAAPKRGRRKARAGSHREGATGTPADAVGPSEAPSPWRRDRGRG